MSEWIDVKEKLPHRGDHVLLIVNGKKNPWAWWSSNRVVGFLDEGRKRWFLHAPGNQRVWHVTHWMPLPEKPAQRVSDQPKRELTHDQSRHTENLPRKRSPSS